MSKENFVGIIERRLIGRIAVVLLMLLLPGQMHSNPNPPAPPPSAAWQINVTRIDPSPQQSGTQMLFRIQLQCSAVSDNACLDTEIRIPVQDPTSFNLPFFHPAIEAFYRDDVSNEWVIDLQDAIYAGTSIEFDLIARAPNHTTPDGTTFTIDATVDGSNTDPASDSASGAWTADANLGVTKYLQFGPNTDALLDIPVKYFLYPCDPTWQNSSSPGHLYVENWTLIDQLPPGTVYNSSSGTYNSGDHTVTWSDTEYLENESCEFEGPTDYWVEVTFPSTVFGAAAVPPVLEVENTAIFEGYAMGAAMEPANLMQDTEILLHGFGLPNPIGTHTKDASTPYARSADITYEDDAASFDIRIRTEASGSTPYFWRITDNLPCLDYTPNATTQYESVDLGDPPCSNMAFQPDSHIMLRIYDAYVSYPDGATFAASNPTIPLQYVDTNGNSGVLNIPFDDLGFGSVEYRMNWADIEAVLGPGVGLSSVVWDSEDIGVQAIVTPQDNRVVAQLSLVGTVAPDTPAYPMLDQYRVRNYAHFDIIYGDNETYIGFIQDDVIIDDRAPILSPVKSVSTTTGLVTLTVTSSGSSFRPGESMIITDLLPLGYTFSHEAQQYMSLQGGNWYWSLGFNATNDTDFPELDNIPVQSYIDVEVIDNYNGTGRQLVRATFNEPPITDGWDTFSGGRFSFYVNEVPMNYSATNYVQAFLTDPVSQEDLHCQWSYYSTPTAASSNDPDDLDADGLTTNDGFCQRSTNIIPTSTFVDIKSYKAVRGDYLPDMEFEGFPAVAGITSTGGSADFQINATNVGGVSLQDFVIYDILPHTGDTGLSQTQVGTPRESDFTAIFDGIDMSTVPAGAVIEYSRSNNPCRDELTTGATPFPTGCVDDWTTVLPSPISDVRALRFTFPAGDYMEFDPGESISIEYSVTYPAGTQVGEIAWNSFAFAGTRTDDLTTILPAEPPKVGIGIPEVDLSVRKSVSTSTAFVGTPVQYTIVIDHDGDVTPNGVYTLPASVARDVLIVDDAISQGLQLVPNSAMILNSSTGLTDGATFNELTGEIFIPEIGPNDTFELTYWAYADDEASIDNTVEIMSIPTEPDSDSTAGNGDPTEDDLDTVGANWVLPSIDLQKLVESEAGSGTYIEADASDGLTGSYTAGQPINYQFVISNNGTTTLSNVALVDSLVGFECDQSVGFLLSGASVTLNCTWPYGYSGSKDPYVNVAGVSGTSTLNGETIEVMDVDSAAVRVCDVPLITDLVDDTICEGGLFDASATSTTVTNGIPVNWQWYNNDGPDNPGTTALSGQTSDKLLALPTTVGVYSYLVEAVYTGGAQCVATSTVTLTITDMTDGPVALAISPTCTGEVPNNDGQIMISLFTNERFDYNLGNTYTGSETYATADPIPADGIIASNLTNPSGAITYTVRIFNDVGCFIDRVVTLEEATCCDANYCVPIIVTPGP